MELMVGILEVNVPLLIGLPTLDEYKLYVNNVTDKLVCIEPEWSHPITRKRGHLFYE